MFNKSKYGSSISYAEKKKRNNVLKTGAIILGTTICVAGIYQFVILDIYGQKIRENTIMQLTNGNSGYVQAYVLTKDIGKGDSLDSAIQPVTKSKDTVPSTCIKNMEDIKGMEARINLSQNTVVTTDMLIDMNEQITDSIKNQDFNWIKVHAFLQAGDYVDIHYKELDGTDTIVAAKKKITKLSGNIFSTDITEFERDLINNATVRAAVTGGELYTTIYPDPENQNAAEVTYTLDKTVQQEIVKDPSVINKSAKTLSKNAENSEKTETPNKQEKPNFAGGNK
ncbi:SAF domain-containing protein (plasmid) [Clostridium beijerinckii]|uniref:SAF domain-containing protein n=1 Tax=Clostridium beijerinckii TaxID=1520 RepID=UPI002227835A|nr:SAF domain-containing protein [Clostridium beijerinckii]UYZ39112.1 SAF domain-containing protein [Clostridium beijerinckii]